MTCVLTVRESVSQPRAFSLPVRRRPHSRPRPRPRPTSHTPIAPLHTSQQQVPSASRKRRRPHPSSVVSAVPSCGCGSTTRRTTSCTTRTRWTARCRPCRHFPRSMNARYDGWRLFAPFCVPQQPASSLWCRVACLAHPAATPRRRASSEGEVMGTFGVRLSVPSLPCQGLACFLAELLRSSPQTVDTPATPCAPGAKLRTCTVRQLLDTVTPDVGGASMLNPDNRFVGLSETNSQNTANRYTAASPLTLQ